MTNELMSDYTTADNALIQKITPVRNINISGLKIQGTLANNSHRGIVITNGINCTIDKIQSYDMDIIHVQLFDCTFCRVINSLFQESNASATGYGTSFADATQDCSAENNIFTDVRHSLSTNNSIGGITRRILFSNNIVTDSALALGLTGGDAIDTHAGAEDILIIGNVVNASSGSGINAECRSATITNNIISFSQGNGITHQNYTDQTGWSNISGNTIRNTLGNYSIAVVPNSASFSSCLITGNITDLHEGSGIRAIPGDFQFVNLVVTGNSVRMTGNSTSSGIDIEAVLAGTVSGNTVLAAAVGITIEDGQSVAITGNSVRLASDTGSTTGYGVRLAGSCYGCVISGNSLYNDSNLTNARAVDFQNSVTYSAAFSNVGSKFTASTKFDLGSGTGNSAANNLEGV